MAPRGANEPVLSRAELRAMAAAEKNKRNDIQRELRTKKLEELEHRFKGKDSVVADDTESSMTKYTCKPHSEWPELLPKRVVFRNETLYVPSNGGHVPFNINHIKAVVERTSPLGDEGPRYTARIAFHVPQTKASSDRHPDLTKEFNALFIKEINLGSDDEMFLHTMKQLKESMKNLKKDVVAVETRQLIINKGGNPPAVLPKVHVRHTFVQGKTHVGSLEAHSNGFRFSGGVRTEAIDILYDNIEHCFLQPAITDWICIIHFTLKRPIHTKAADPKKTITEIQFYRELIGVDDPMIRGRHDQIDPDEVMMEVREKEMRSRTNSIFKRFCEAAIQIAANVGVELNFQIPSRKLVFQGCPKNQSVMLSPTRQCLVSLVEWPPFVLNLSTVDCVAFERVANGVRTFDMIFIPRVYKENVRSIGSIPADHLNQLKDWLNGIDKVWYEQPHTLNWTKVMNYIRADIHGFIGKGGYSAILSDQIDNIQPPSSDSSDDEDDGVYSPSEEASDESDSDDLSDVSVYESSEDDDESIESDAESDEESEPEDARPKAKRMKH